MKTSKTYIKDKVSFIISIIVSLLLVFIYFKGYIEQGNSLLAIIILLPIVNYTISRLKQKKYYYGIGAMFISISITIFWVIPFL